MRRDQSTRQQARPKFGECMNPDLARRYRAFDHIEAKKPVCDVRVELFFNGN